MEMEVKTNSEAETLASVVLNIHKGENQNLKYNMGDTNPTTHNGETLEDGESLTYMESIIDERGGCDAEVKARIGEARIAFK